MDISPAVLATSDVLNAGDVLGDVTITVMGAVPSEVRTESGQKVVKVNLITDVYGPERPWVMPKTPLKEVGKVWGKDTTAWVGRRMTLFNLTSVTNKGKVTGGVRIKAMSHIDKPITYAPPAADGLGKGGKLTIQPLPDAPTPAPDASKVPAAVNAISTAATLDALDAIETHARSLGIEGHADIVAALETRRQELT